MSMENALTAASANEKLRKKSIGQTTPMTLIDFLQEKLSISTTEIALAQQQGEEQNLLPLILWQCELLTLEQLEQVFDWLEANSEKLDASKQIL